MLDTPVTLFTIGSLIRGTGKGAHARTGCRKAIPGLSAAIVSQNLIEEMAQARRKELPSTSRPWSPARDHYLLRSGRREFFCSTSR